jgi:hypothetical protein
MSSRLPWPSIRPTSRAISSGDKLETQPLRSRGLAPLLRGLVCLAFLGLALASCGWQADTPAVVKIGVIAPFEGVGRELGYAILPTVKAELAVVNGTGVLGSYRVALIALNDDLDPEGAAMQARALAQDRDVLAVIGLWSEATAQSAAPVLEKSGVPTLLSAPDPGSGGATLSLCPTPDRVAKELLDRVALESDGALVVVAGPDNLQRKALLELSPELPVVSESAPDPCPIDPSHGCFVIHTGDAATAAEALFRWRMMGWNGHFVVGPDAGRPWFITQAGAAAEGVRAVICGNPLAVPQYQDASTAATAELARSEARLVLTALERLIGSGLEPTRSSVSEALASQTPSRNLAWIEVMSGEWVPLRE